MSHIDDIACTAALSVHLMLPLVIFPENRILWKIRNNKIFQKKQLNSYLINYQFCHSDPVILHHDKKKIFIYGGGLLSSRHTLQRWAHTCTQLICRRRNTALGRHAPCAENIRSPPVQRAAQEMKNTRRRGRGQRHGWAKKLYEDPGSRAAASADVFLQSSQSQPALVLRPRPQSL